MSARGYRFTVLMVISLAALSGAGFAWHANRTQPETSGVDTGAADSLLQEWQKTPPVPVSPSAEPKSIIVKPAVYVYGKGLAILSIPAINLAKASIAEMGEGDNEELPVLKRNVGHYKGTALPGQVGNFATAAHRCCRVKSSYYKHIDKLTEGDEITVTTRDHVYTYRVVILPECSTTAVYTVKKDQGNVLFPSPCTQHGPTRKLMTLTTCTPDGYAETNYRLIVHAELTEVS